MSRENRDRITFWWLFVGPALATAFTWAIAAQVEASKGMERDRRILALESAVIGIGGDTTAIKQAVARIEGRLQGR